MNRDWFAITMSLIAIALAFWSVWMTWKRVRYLEERLEIHAEHHILAAELGYSERAAAYFDGLRDAKETGE